MRQIVSLAAVLGCILTLAPVELACAQAILSPPPVISPTYIAVPPPQQEIITPAPGPSYVWVPGQWERTADSWSWKPSRWVQPPLSNAYWVPGYWQHNGGKFLWTNAHWAAADRGVVVQKPVTVPPLYEEVAPSPPAQTGWAWQPGYWEWRGTWVWMPGRYIQTVTPGAIWVAGKWEPTIDGSWRWNPAHWAMA
jgi:WXXGXW repeat (2 copies)